MIHKISWLSKYNPNSLDEFVGNKQQIEKLREWIIKFKQDGSFPIAYIYGSTGIGKTSLAYLLLRMYDYDVYELNSSEIRSKKRMEDIVEKIMGHKMIATLKKKQKKNSVQLSPSLCIALLMDETDGMSCGDKGGLHYLFEIINKAKTGTLINPVICVGTKPYDKRNNENIMLDISLDLPQIEEIKQRCMFIAQSEGMYIDQEVLEQIIKFCKCDIRKTIVMMQQLHDFFPESPILKEHYECVSHFFEEKQNDGDLFNVTEDLCGNRLSSYKINHYYQIEPNLIPMMLYENIPSQFEKRKMTQQETIENYYNILNYLCVGDIIENVSLLHTELSYHCGVIKCEYINNLLTEYPNKNTKKVSTEKIKFTGTLSKSALVSNNQSFLFEFSVTQNISHYYIPYFIEFMYICLKNLNNLNISDFNRLQEIIELSGQYYDKIIQFSQKWFCINVQTISKIKKEMKKFLLKETPNENK